MKFLHTVLVFLLYSNTGLAQKTFDIKAYFARQDTLLNGRIIIERDTHYLDSHHDSIAHFVSLYEDGIDKEKIWEFYNYSSEKDKYAWARTRIKQIVLGQNNCSILLKDSELFRLVELKREENGQWVETTKHDLHSDIYYRAGYVDDDEKRTLISDSLYLRLVLKTRDYLNPPESLLMVGLSSDRPSELYQLQPNGKMLVVPHLASNEKLIANLIIQALNKKSCEGGFKREAIQFLGMLKDSTAQSFLLQNLQPVPQERRPPHIRTSRGGVQCSNDCPRCDYPYYYALLDNLDWNIIPLIINELRSITKEKFQLFRFANLLFLIVGNDGIVAMNFIKSHLEQVQNSSEQEVFLKNLEQLKLSLTTIITK